MKNFYCFGRHFNNVILISAKGVPFNGWGGNGKYMKHEIFGSWRNNKDS